jgi:E3 ubiquitin-protein ligase SHPRH
LETLDTAEIEVNALIDDLRTRLEKLNLQASKSKHREQETSGHKKGNGKGKERENSPEPQADEGEDTDDDIGKRNGIAHRLREAEILLHKVAFFMGDVYHTLGAKYSKEEDSAYGKAEEIRKKLLKGEPHIPVATPLLTS